MYYIFKVGWTETDRGKVIVKAESLGDARQILADKVGPRFITESFSVDRIIE